MVEIAATPEMAAKIYARMASNLEVVRRRLGAPLTLADKVLLQAILDAPETQELARGHSQLALRSPTVWCFRTCWARVRCCSSCRLGATAWRWPPPSTATT